MKRLLALALVLTGALVLSVGISAAGASGKFAYTEAVQFPSGNLLVTFDEGGQKRFTSVDYQLDATAVRTSCDPTGQQCIAVRFDPTDTVAGLVPDDKGRVAGSLTLDAPSGGGTCSCILHMEYSDVTLTNLTSRHVYRLDPVVGDSP
jgi:hypothetical protein